jgi:hypothetical protein
VHDASILGLWAAAQRTTNPPFYHAYARYQYNRPAGLATVMKSSKRELRQILKGCEGQDEKWWRGEAWPLLCRFGLKPALLKKVAASGG